MESEQHGGKSGLAQTLRGYLVLVRFILPLIITNMAPDIAEQALNRGITTIATEEMEKLLASMGLAFQLIKLVQGGSMEMRQVGIVLVDSKKTYWRILRLVIAWGVLASLILMVLGLTELGTLLLENLHHVSHGVSEETKTILLYLCPLMVMESISRYHEGCLLVKKHTILAAAINFTDIGMQILFTTVYLFTTTRTDPVLIPIFSMYAGYLGRMILAVGFFFVYVYREIPAKPSTTEESVTIGRAILFWMPLALVKTMQMLARPLINLFVARNQAPYGRADTALAILAAAFPISRLPFSFLNDLRVMIPTFHKRTTDHRFYTIRELSVFALGCGCVSLLLSLGLFWLPSVAYAIMRTGVGLSEELAQGTIVPLQIFAFVPIAVMFRAHSTSYLLYRKKTVFITPSGIVRIVSTIVALIAFPYMGVNGASMGMAALLTGFAFESMTCSIAGLLLLKCSPEKKTEELEDESFMIESTPGTNRKTIKLDPTVSGSRTSLNLSRRSLHSGQEDVLFDGSTFGRGGTSSQSGSFSRHRSGKDGVST